MAAVGFPDYHLLVPVPKDRPAAQDAVLTLRVVCQRRLYFQKEEPQLDVFVDRLSAATFQANQPRLWLASAAYALMHGLSRVRTGGHRGVPRLRVCANTIRLELLKICAVATMSVRWVKRAMSEACGQQREFIVAIHVLSAVTR